MRHKRPAALLNACFLLIALSIVALLCCLLGVDGDGTQVIEPPQAEKGYVEEAVSNDIVSVPLLKSIEEGKRIEEAELIALCASGELRAPAELSAQVGRDMETIRATFGDEFPFLKDIIFRAPWVPGCLIIGVDENTTQQVALGTYHDWDVLNQRCGLQEVSSILPSCFLLSFQDRLHPERLAEIYGSLPGVEYAEPDCSVGDSSNIYVIQREQGLSYLFRLGCGDSPSGCIHNEYWHFIVEEGYPTFLGHQADEGSEPEGWDDGEGAVS